MEPSADRPRRCSLALARGAAVALFGFFVALAGGAQAASGPAKVLRIEGDINGATADFLQRGIEQSLVEGASVLVVELDTPGGLLDATKDMVSDILNAELPVVVFVAPRGAWAGSAGTFITMAGHVAAMAPGTTIGAAHPVLIGRERQPTPPQQPYDPEKDGDTPPPAPAERDVLGEKMENFTAAFIESIAEQRGRNTEWAIDAVRRSVAVTQQDALDKGVIDLIAEDVADLLEKIHGREVRVGSETQAIDTAGAVIERIEMTGLDQFFAFLSDPSVISLLIMGGLLGLYMEFSNPGLLIPGGLGAISLILAGFGMRMIPFNALGVVLIGLGVVLMATEIFVPTMGLIFAAGVICLGVGGYVLFDVPELGDVSVPFWTIMFPSVLVVSIAGALIVFGVSKSFRAPTFAGSGAEGLIGQLARVESDLSPTGRVFLHGESWTAECSEPVRRGEKVRVEAIRDLVLRVSPVRDTEGVVG